MNERIKWIDYGKAIAIFMVMWGHTRLYGPVYVAQYMFSMPFFFFASGYLFSFEKHVLRIPQVYRPVVVPAVARGCRLRNGRNNAPTTILHKHGIRGHHILLLRIYFQAKQQIKGETHRLATGNNMYSRLLYNSVYQRQNNDAYKRIWRKCIALYHGTSSLLCIGVQPVPNASKKHPRHKIFIIYGTQYSDYMRHTHDNIYIAERGDGLHS